MNNVKPLPQTNRTTCIELYCLLFRLINFAMLVLLCFFVSRIELISVFYINLQHCSLVENPNALKVKIKLTDLCPILKLSFDCLLHILSYLPLIDLCR